jgi:hypothetical protein
MMMMSLAPAVLWPTNSIQFVVVGSRRNSRVFNDLIDDSTKSDFRSFWDDFEIFKIILKLGDLVCDLVFENVHENQISNNLKSCFQIATKHLISSVKTREIP